MISFKLKKSNFEVKSQEELQSKLENQFSNFEPGNYDFAITKAEWHLKDGSAACAGDPTWQNLKVELTCVDSRKLNVFIQVPTERITYGEKKTYAVFRKFSEFMAATGNPVTIDNLEKVVPKVFTDPDKSLKGKAVNADLGFEGAHIEQCEGGFKIVQANGKDLLDDDGELYVLPDRKSAASTAESKKIKTGFITVTKYTPGKIKVEKKAEAEDSWD